jgi:ribosomal protein L11 methyltransferase
VPAAYLQLTLELGRSDPVPVEEALFALGAISVTLEDAADNPVLEPAPGATPLWPTVRARALFGSGHDRMALADALRERAPGLPSPRFDELPERVWEREWMRDFRPMRFGRRLWICPGGLEPDDPHGIRVELDPGLAFGTGSHPTTAMCLAWLDGRELGGRTLIDYGCGSGILALAALKLDASEVVAFDVDPQALLATRENALRNGVIDRLRIVAEAPDRRDCCDVLVANILAAPLIAEAPRFRRLLRPGGEIALSGILVDQAGAVTASYRPWFDIDITAVRDGWALLSGRRGRGI